MLARTMFSVSETEVGKVRRRKSRNSERHRTGCPDRRRGIRLSRQVRREGEFDTGAGGPAGLRRAAERKRGARSLDIAEGGAARP